MFRYTFLRIAGALPLLVALSIATFAVIQLPPGDYADYLRQSAINRSGVSAEAADEIARDFREKHGLDQPLIIQYAQWMKGIVTEGDFGISFRFNRPIGEVIEERLPRTLFLALASHLIGSAIGILFGVWAATRQYSWVDTTLSFIAFLGITVPRFLFALIVLYLLVFRFGVSEVGSFYSPQYSAAPWSLDKLWNLVLHIWPVVAIAAVGSIAYNMRVMRSNLLDVLNSQYIEAARAKGLSESGVIWRHAVPNALHPLVAYQGIALPYMLTGEIEVAVVFGLATLGPAIVSSMQVGDIYLTASIMMMLAVVLIIGNILADILLGLLDPRIRLGSAAA